VLEYLRDFYKEAALDFPKSIASDKAGGLINAIAEIFPGVPHLLYIWHVNNDIEAHCRRLWKTEIDISKAYTTAQERAQFVQSRWIDFQELWRNMLYAKTESAYGDAWDKLTARYWSEYPEILSYLADTWLYHKEKICMAWTNKITHFGNATTQRAEGIHNAVKKDLPHRLLYIRDI
jgi:hypothetical protein